MNFHRSTTAIRHACAVLVSLMLGSCASGTRTDPPPPGMAVLDATPNADRRDRIDGIRIVAVNGIPANGTEAELSPGKNQIRVRFKWPQGGSQEVDLGFNARPDIIYAIYYDVYPPLVHRPGGLESTTGAIMNDLPRDGGSGLVAAIAAGFMAPFAATEAAVKRTDENSEAADHVDLMVVAQRSPQGIACTRRVHADGRIERR